MRVFIGGVTAHSLVNFRGSLMQAMTDLGHEVVACASDSPGEIISRLSELGVEYHEIPLQRTGVNLLFDLRTIASLRSLLRVQRPDCALFYTIKPVIYGSLASRWAGVPRVFSMITGLGYAFGQDTLRQRMLSKAVCHLYRRALRTNEAVFFQNPDDMALFVERRLIDDPGKAVLINGSGVDLAHYQKTPPATSGPVFLLIARLLKDKGIYEYVEAARIIKQKYPDSAFWLVGPFDSNPSAIDQSTVEQWQAEGIIEYLGRTLDVRPYIAQSSVYVLPSYREGTPRSVLEAMAMGRPIITTDAPGCRETVVGGRNGYLVPVKDAKRLAEAMEKFVLFPHLIAEMGEESWRIAAEKYDVHKVNAVVLSIMGLQ